MANALGLYNPLFYANEALDILTKSLGMASRVHMGFDKERGTFNKGDTINIRRPTVFTVQDAPSTAQDLNPDSLSLVLNSWKEVKFKLSDKEFSFTQKQIIDEHILPAAYAIADYIDQDLASLAYEVGPIVTAGASTYAATDITKARKSLFDTLCPLNDASKLSLMVGGAAEKDFLDSSAFAQWNGAGGSGEAAQVSGVLGSRYGFGRIWANQNVNQLNYSAFTLTSPTVSGAHAKGATSLVIAATTVNAQVIPKGFSFTIAGDTQVYAVKANVTVSGTGGATVTISPPLAVAHANSDVITPHASTPIAGVTTKDQNLAFHRNAFAMAFGKLPDYDELGQGFGMKIASVQDPVTNIAIRARLYAMPDASEIRVALDALWGKATLNPNLAARLRAA